MKVTKFFLAILCISIIACKQKQEYYTPVNPNATPEAKALLKSLYQSVENGKIISALHHNNLNPDRYSADLDRIFEASGKIPMMWGGDMGWDQEKVIELATGEYEKGRLVTLMWHSQRPLDEGRTDFRNECQGAFSDEEWQQLVTPGTDMYNGWLAKADSVAKYLQQLKERKIPVLWRPYHEMNGEWFWWGDRKGENGFVKLWKMMYDRYVNYHHLDNLIWVWNANGPRNTPDNAYDYSLYFPGLDFVDVLATDIYHNDWKQSHHDQLVELGEGKLIALGEIGNMPTPEILMNQNKYAWFMIWTGFTSNRYTTPEAIKDVFTWPNTVNWEPKNK